MVDVVDLPLSGVNLILFIFVGFLSLVQTHALEIKWCV